MSARIFVCLLAVLAALAPAPRLSAQSIGLPPPSEDYVLKTWTVDDGLPESSPTYMAQTPDGYLWIGTWNGLARFDGARFVSFHSGNTPAFRVSRISVLSVAADSTLWIGTGGGGLISFRQGVFRSFGRESGLTDLFINGCATDRRGNLWVGTDRGLFVGRDGIFRRATADRPELAGRILRVYADSLGHIYANAGGSSYQLTFDNGAVKLLTSSVGREVVVDSRGRIWAWDRSTNLHLLEEDREVDYSMFQPFRHTSSWPLQDGGLGICFLNRVVLIRDGGVTYLPAVGETRLTAAEVLFEDREGNVWLGRASSGLARIRKKSLTVLSTSSGLSSEIATSIIEDGSGTLLVGTYRQGLDRRVGDRFRRSYGRAVDSAKTVNLLWRDPQGDVWAGANERGLVRIRDAMHYERGIVSATTNVTAVDVDGHGSWWIGTAGMGVQRDSAGRLSVWNEDSGLSANEVTALACVSDGSTWIGTSAHGVNRILNGQSTAFTTQEGLTSNEVQSILEDPSGSVWIATRRGLNRWKHGEMRGLRERDGLADEAISSMVEDGLGFMWFGGTKGIFRASLADLHARADGSERPVRCRALGTEDGLVSSEVGGAGTPRAWRDRSGILWFASERGLIRIDPRSIEENSVPPPVILEEVMVDHEPVPLAAPIRLDPGHSKVEFQFTGISFRSTNRVRFRYQLEGLEQTWQDGGNRRFVQYTHLPTGEYTFRVSAANSDGVWNDEGASMTVVVLPPFYATWWFMALLGMFFAVGGPSIYYLRIRSLKLEQQRQQEFSRKLLERQEEERRRISRDLHDSLGQELLVLKHRIQSRLRARRLAKETSSLLDGLSETVSGAIMQVRQISHNLRPPELDRLGLSETLRAILERVRSAAVFDLSGVVDDVDGCFATEDEINVVRILQEAINNAIKHSRATAVRVSVQRLERQVVIAIEDNGAGIAPSDGRKDGIGLADMHERARLMRGSLEIERVATGGTRLRITLPMKGT